MRRKRVLITGSSGMLGKDIVDEMLNRNEFDIYGISRSQKINSRIKEYVCDLVDFKRVKEILSEIEPDIIIHCAANVNVDSCEKNKNAAYQINSEA
ncbi:MAG: sugar nucleotide-binding protein, partial [Acholeplasma sp.]|nr:sugar nucleotide-binding protein [Acholeplasma sp.]